MTLDEMIKNALPENEDAVKAIKKYVHDNNLKFADLGEGQYVGLEKYNAMEKKYNDLKNAENPFETKYNELVVKSASDLEDERTKLKGVVKNIAVQSAIDALGVDRLLAQGIKALVNTEAIEIDDNYNIKGDTLSKQLDAIKNDYKDSFDNKATMKSTGNAINNSSRAQDGSKTYSSLAEIRGMSREAVMADLDNITAQLSNLK